MGNLAPRGASFEKRKELEQWGVDLKLEVTSGGSSEGKPAVATNLDDLTRFLEEVKTGEKKFAVAPMELTLASYWETLTEWKKTQDLLKPDEGFKVPIAHYGVPKGTILAWNPTMDYIKGLDMVSSKQEIVPPPGWAICDGTQGTPGLKDHFIMGAATWEEVGFVGGTEEDPIMVKIEDVARKKGAVSATKKAVVDVKWKGYIPPNVKMVYS